MVVHALSALDSWPTSQEGGGLKLRTGAQAANLRLELSQDLHAMFPWHER